MALKASGLCVHLPIRQASSIYRKFSTSLPVLASGVPPESPSYIRLPNPPQSDETKPPRVRGHLPVPREVFPRSERDRKLRPEYIHRTAPRSMKPYKATTDAQKWKTAMAESRRANLKEGLDALWARRLDIDGSRKNRVGRKFQVHNQAGAARERDDDRLTRPTVLGSMMDTKVYADPDRFARADKSRTKITALENTKRESRRDALMELYISAENFIVHETELKAKIDEIFAEDYFRNKGKDDHLYGATENTWGVYGKPPSIANMMETSMGRSTKVMNFDQSEHDRSAMRQKKISEDLTGGTMS